MKKLFFLITFLAIQVAFSQENTKTATIPSTDEAIYTTDQVTTAPQFTGGNQALQQFIKRNFKQPTIAGIKGEVLVSFLVEKNGTITEIGILQDAGHGTGDEAIRVMTISPTWIPGMLNGNAVRTQYMITISVNSN